MILTTSQSLCFNACRSIVVFHVRWSKFGGSTSRPHQQRRHKRASTTTNDELVSSLMMRNPQQLSCHSRRIQQRHPRRSSCVSVDADRSIPRSVTVIAAPYVNNNASGKTRQLRTTDVTDIPDHQVYVYHASPHLLPSDRRQVTGQTMSKISK